MPGRAKLEEALDRLYAAPPAEFTGVRRELERALASAGLKAEAARVRAMRRPPAAIWALNQLRRRAPERLERFLEAGDELRSAQRRVMRGAAPSELRRASEAERSLVRQLEQEASKALESAGLKAGPPSMRLIAQSLEAAASAREEDRRALARGRLEGPLTAAGFDELLAGFAAGPAPARPSRRRPAPAKAGVRAAAADRQREERERRHRERQERQRLARLTADREGAASRAEAEAARLQREAERAEFAAAQARARAAAARRNAQEAREAARRAAEDPGAQLH